MAKPMSHKNCTHKKTNHARAKCRAARLAAITDKGEDLTGSVQVGQNTTGDGMSVAQLANLLATSLDSLRLAEKRVEDHQRAAEMAQEALTREMLSREPKPNADGDSPVVAFRKRYSRDETKTYEFVAIGIPQEYIRSSDAHPDMEVFGYRIMWYVSAGRRAISPMPWAELVKFMGVKGLETLQVLRAG
ncbi:hypothetical protein HOS75_gp050 [Gordonia phage SteveFrench]|uniref:Uncharacterized protein n=2 Tax=Montyvirus stevefrench TaxID=2734258 RepID=A0A890UPY3_9CAUD|nr:hypothetical protein HOS75_gp050 [Gordonia phage SteveFrench]AUV60680.1 hypothetical protein SEA_STEVEFRENCH_78 [Gordonia phage SteveFrench]QRI45663.1 hypothetical protein SEA_ROYALG_79 [Gordonia phage RoyalG]